MQRILLTVFLVAAVLAPLRSERLVQAETIALRPTQDAFVNSSAPDKNYGAAGQLQLKGGSGTNIRSFISFDISELPGPITKAVLRLSVNDSGVTPTEVYVADSGWSEIDVTWNTQPERLAGVGSGGEGAAAGSWIELDLTAVMTGAGRYDLGLLTSSDDQIDYLSRDSSQEEGRPELVITYEAAVPTATTPAELTEETPATSTEPASPGPAVAGTPAAESAVVPDGERIGTLTPGPSDAPTASTASTEAPVLLLSETGGHVYERLRIHVRHFPVNTRVAIRFDGARMVTVTTNDEGSARSSFTVPRATAGLHTIRAAGGGEEATRRFRIHPQVSISRTSVEAGRSVTFTVRGFGPSAPVAIRLYGLGSTTRYVTLGSATTSSTGTGQASFIIGAGTLAGPHTVTASQGSYLDDAMLHVTRPADITFSAVGDLMTSNRVGSPAYQRANRACRLAGQEELFLALGDLQYQNGSSELFSTRYDVSACGDIKGKTRPIPGNHEYETRGASGYFRYFGSRAGDPATGYYSFHQGGVHFIAVNSNCDEISGGCGSSGAQYQFIKRDLSANPERCTVMYFHHPRYGSGKHGSNTSMDPIWDLFVRGGGDILLSGHDHNYERFSPMNSDGKADMEGVRQFVVGTGGVSFYDFLSAQPSSEVRITDVAGVLKVTVSGSTYEWRFVSINGDVLDSGRGNCN